MELETISIKKEEAATKLAEYREAMKKSKSQDLKQLSKLYAAAAKGKRILDLYATMKAAGSAILNEDGEPKIGIGRIGWKRVAFKKGNESFGSNSGGKYYDADQNRWRTHSEKFDVVLPVGTFPVPWKTQANGQLREIVNTLVPMVPVQHQPSHPNVEELPYYILWEVDKWIPQAPKDPYLLRRVTANLFIIEAKWNTTKLERAFVNGRVGT